MYCFVPYNHLYMLIILLQNITWNIIMFIKKDIFYRSYIYKIYSSWWPTLINVILFIEKNILYCAYIRKFYCLWLFTIKNIILYRLKKIYFTIYIFRNSLMIPTKKLMTTQILAIPTSVANDYLIFLQFQF